MSKKNNFFEKTMYINQHSQTPGHAERRLLGIEDIILLGLNQCPDVHLRRLIKIIWVQIWLLADNFGNFTSEEVSAYAADCDCTLKELNDALDWLVRLRAIESFTDRNSNRGYHVVGWAQWTTFWDNRHSVRLVPLTSHVQDLLDRGWTAKGDYVGTDATEICQILSGNGAISSDMSQIEEIRDDWNTIAKKWAKIPGHRIKSVRIRQKLSGEIVEAIRIAGGKNTLELALEDWGNCPDCIKYTWDDLAKNDYALLKALVLHPEDTDMPKTETTLQMPDIPIDWEMPVDLCQTKDGRIMAYSNMTAVDLIRFGVAKRGPTPDEYNQRNSV